MSSVVINVPSGYVNAGLLLVIEILIINFLVATVRRRFESYFSSRALVNGEIIALRQLSFFGINARRDRISMILACFMIVTVLAFGIVESGVNGETKFSMQNRSGFVYGGDNAVGTSNVTTGTPQQKHRPDANVKSSKVLHIKLQHKPIHVQKDIMEKCSRIYYLPVHNSELELIVDLSLSRAALTIESNPIHMPDHSIAINISNSKISCLHDNITVRDMRDIRLKPTATEIYPLDKNNSAVNVSKLLPSNEELSNCSFTSVSANYNKMIIGHSNSSAWTQKQSATVWKSQFYYQFLRKSLRINMCLSIEGYSKRYIVLVETDREVDSVIIWDIHRKTKGRETSYRMIQAQISNQSDVSTIRDYEVHSNMKLGHSLFLAILVSSRTVSQEFPTELRDIFYSNIGRYDGELVYMKDPSVNSDVIFGETGTQNSFVKRTFRFGYSVQATRLEMWSIISFCLLIVILIVLYASSLIMRKLSPVYVDPMSSDWLGSALLRTRSGEVDFDNESITSLRMIDSLDETRRKVVILDRNNPNHCVNIEATLSPNFR